MKTFISQYCLYYLTILYFVTHFFHPVQANESLSRPQLRYPEIIDSIYQDKGNGIALLWQNEELISELKKQIFVFIVAGIDNQLINSYQALQKAEQQHDPILFDQLASDLLLFYLAYTEHKKTEGKKWLFSKKHGCFIHSSFTTIYRCLF
ncbi:hypothetical protein [Psychromonas sp. MME2]|uniref:hypothetical protein n=1 Tax=Psychromonas sp. MME2 TaxID=3231033 RepID=UPI00339D228A